MSPESLPALAALALALALSLAALLAMARAEKGPRRGRAFSPPQF